MGKMKRNPMMAQRSMRFGNNYVVVKSIKNGGLMAFESELEYLAFLPFETDINVLSIEMHPKIADIVAGEGMLDEEIPGGYLDMQVSWRGGRTEYIEIKYASDLEEGNDSSTAQRSRKQVEIQKAFCESRGLEYRIITDQDLHPRTSYLNNLVYIRSVLDKAMQRKNVVELQSKAVLEAIREYDRIRIEEMTFLFSDASTLMECICFLYYCRKIDIDLESAPISGITEVRCF